MMRDKAMRIALLVLLAVLMATAVAIAGSVEIPEGFELVSENRLLAFYLNRADSQILIHDKRNDHVWRTGPDVDTGSMNISELWKTHMRSVFILHYTDENKRTPKQTNNIASNAVIYYRRIKGGIEASYELQSLGITITLQFRLGRDYFEVSIPEGGIKETKRPKAKNPVFMVTQIELLPFFGAASDQDEGYLLIPDGGGALSYFKEDHPQYTRNFQETVYGEHQFEFLSYLEKKIRKKSVVVMPVFGLARLNDQAAFLGIITEGDFDSRVTASPSGYVVNFSRINPVFIVRRDYMAPLRAHVNVPTYEDEVIPTDRTARYYLLAGEQADYVGMADAYRRFLMVERDVEKMTGQRDVPPMQLRIFNGVSKKVMVWHEYELMTSFREARKIVEALEDAGVNSMDVSLIGWNFLGFDGAYPKRLPSAAPAGGNDALRELASFARLRGYDLLLDDNYLYAFEFAGGFNKRRDCVRGPNKLPVYDSGGRMGQGYAGLYLLNPVFAYEKIAKRDIPRMADLGATGVLLRHLGKTVLMDRNFANPLERWEFADWWLRIADLARRELGRAASDGANAYVIGHIDLIVDTPMDPSIYEFVDDIIPFYQMVIHGMVPYTTYPGNLRSDPKREYLRTIEYGALPTFELTYRRPAELKDTKYNRLFSSYYEEWVDRAADEFSAICGELGYLQSLYIIGHDIVAPNVKRVIYEDGSKVYINYNEEPVTVDGIEVGALDYVLVKGGSES